MKKLLFLLSVISLTGCVSSNLTEFQKAVGNSHNTGVAKVSTIYGTGFFVFVGQQTNTDVTVSPDGTVMVKSH